MFYLNIAIHIIINFYQSESGRNYVMPDFVISFNIIDLYLRIYLVLDYIEHGLLLISQQK